MKRLARMDDPQEMEWFFAVTFTEKERQMIEERWRIFEALSEGASQRKAAQQTGAGIATITRGAKAYREEEQKINAFIEHVSNANQTQ